MLPPGFKSHTIVQEREMLWKIPKILALRMAVWGSFLSRSEVLQVFVSFIGRQAIQHVRDIVYDC